MTQPNSFAFDFPDDLTYTRIFDDNGNITWTPNKTHFTQRNIEHAREFGSVVYHFNSSEDFWSIGSCNMPVKEPKLEEKYKFLLENIDKQAAEREKQIQEDARTQKRYELSLSIEQAL